MNRFARVYSVKDPLEWLELCSCLNHLYIFPNVLFVYQYLSCMGSIPGTTRKKSSGSGTGSTHPREYN
jgi:hypothetical protein